MANGYWTDLLGLDKKQINDLRALGYTYVIQGAYEIAEKIFEGVAVLSGEELYDIQMLGSIYLELGENHKALNEIDKALVADPSNIKMQLNRAKALFSLGPNYRKSAIDQAKALIKVSDYKIANKAASLLRPYIA